MLIHGKQYLKTLRERIGEARTASIAVAFWGRGAEFVFEEWRGDKLRVICNLVLGGTNPLAVKAMMKIPNVELRHCGELHAKVVLTDSVLIVGSANISSNGLGLEKEEAAKFHEVGVLSNDAAMRLEAQRWFDALWASADVISKNDLSVAEAAWKRRRQNRPLLPGGRPGALLEQPPDRLRDRAIFIVVYRSGLSQTAEKALRVEQTRAQGMSSEFQHDKLDLYEGWDAGTLPLGREDILIPIYWGARGKITVDKPQRPLPELKSKYKDEDGVNVCLDFSIQLDDDRVLGYTFKPKDRKYLESGIRPWLESLGIEPDDGRAVPLYDYLKWRERQG